MSVRQLDGGAVTAACGQRQAACVRGGERYTPEWIEHGHFELKFFQLDGPPRIVAELREFNLVDLVDISLTVFTGSTKKKTNQIFSDTVLLFLLALSLNEVPDCICSEDTFFLEGPL